MAIGFSFSFLFFLLLPTSSITYPVNAPFFISNRVHCVNYLVQGILIMCGAIIYTVNACMSDDPLEHSYFSTPHTVAISQNDKTEINRWHLCVFSAFIKHCIFHIHSDTGLSHLCLRPMCNMLILLPPKTLSFLTVWLITPPTVPIEINGSETGWAFYLMLGLCSSDLDTDMISHF